MKEPIYLYPVWVRVWHWVNAILFIFLIVSGLSLQYSSQEFTLMPFGTSVSMHNIAGIALCILYVFFLFLNHFSQNGAHYKIKRKDYWQLLLKQIRYYSYGIFKGEECPFPITADNKFNPLQKFSYVAVMYVLMPVIVISGLALFFPEILPDRIFNTTGIHLFDLIHIITGFFLSIFLLVHLYFCTIGKTPLSNFKSMFTGWHY